MRELTGEELILAMKKEMQARKTRKYNQRMKNILMWSLAIVAGLVIILAMTYKKL